MESIIQQRQETESQEILTKFKRLKELQGGLLKTARENLYKLETEKAQIREHGFACGPDRIRRGSCIFAAEIIEEYFKRKYENDDELIKNLITKCKQKVGENNFNKLEECCSKIPSIRDNLDKMVEEEKELNDYFQESSCPERLVKLIELEQEESLKALDKSQEYHELKIQELNRQHEQELTELRTQIEH